MWKRQPTGVVSGLSVVRQGGAFQPCSELHHSPGGHGVQLQGWLAAPVTLLSLSQNAPFSAQSLPGGDPMLDPAGLDLGCAANKHGAGARAG